MITKTAVAAWRRMQPWLGDTIRNHPLYKAFLNDARIPVEREVQGLNKGTDNLLDKYNGVMLNPPEDIKPIIDDYFVGDGHAYCTFDGNNSLNMRKKLDDYFHVVPSGSRDPRYVAYGEDTLNKALDYLANLDKNKFYVYATRNPAAVFNNWAEKFGINKTYTAGSADTLLMDALSRRHEAYEVAESYKKAKKGISTKGTVFYRANPYLEVKKVGSHQNARVLTNEAKVYNGLYNRDRADLLGAMRVYTRENNLLTENLPSHLKGKLDVYGNKKSRLPYYMTNRDYNITAKNVSPINIDNIRQDMYNQLGIVNPTTREELIVNYYAPRLHNQISKGGNFVFFKHKG